MASDYRVPRQKGTYEKLIEKLKANGVKLSPYDKDFDLSAEGDTAKFVEYLKEQRGKDGAPDGTSLGFFTRIEEDSKQNIDSTEIPTQKYEICNGNCLKEYLVEVQSNPNCAYKSMYNELIKSGYIPKYFSVLIKDCHNNPDSIKAELFGSEVANLLGVPTVYNFGLKDGSEKPKKWTGEIIGDYFALGSLDFVPYGYSVETFKGLSEKRYKRIYPSLLLWDDFVETALVDRFGDAITVEQKKKIHEEFVMSYLLRKIVFPDYDFAVYNSGIMINDEAGDIQLTPNFDMEGMLYDYIYSPYAPTVWSNRAIKNDLDYALTNYSDITNKFMWALKYNHENGEIKAILDKTIGTIDSPYVYKNVDKLISNTLGIYSKLKTESKDLSIKK